MDSLGLYWQLGAVAQEELRFPSKDHPEVVEVVVVLHPEIQASAVAEGEEEVVVEAC